MASKVIDRDERKRRRITKALDMFPYVRWDRFCSASDTSETAFGWINREQDAYKDFMVLYFNADGSVDSFITSSAKYSLAIYKKLSGGSGRGHRKCKRIEHYFTAKNAIKL